MDRFQDPAFTQALEERRPELAALSPSELLDVRFDVLPAVVIALGTAPKVRSLRGAIAAELGEEGARWVDRLEVDARAAAKADQLYRVTLGGVDLGELSDRVVAERARLVADAQSLVNRKLLSPEKLGELRGTQGFVNQCSDVLQLTTALREVWPSIEGKTPLTLADLDRAEGSANELATFFGERSQVAPQASPSADLRRRAFTLFFRTYDQVRRHVAYVRWHEEDADDFAPSLYAMMRRRSSTDDDEAPEGPPS